MSTRLADALLISLFRQFSVALRRDHTSEGITPRKGSATLR